MHDLLQAQVDFLTRPTEVQRILAHLQTRNGHAPGVRRLARAVADLFLDELVHRVRLGGHIRPFRNQNTAVLQQGLGVLAADLVFRRAWKGALTLDTPGPLIRKKPHIEPIGVLADAPAAHLLQVHHPGELLGIDPVRIVDETAGVRERDDLGAQLIELLHGVLGDVAGARNGADFPLQTVAAGRQHLLGEIGRTVTGGFGPDQRAAPLGTLSGERARELILDALVLAKQIADFTPAHADIARGYVGVRTDVAEQLGHERLAEAHDLQVALALRIEIRASLAPAHRQCGQRVLEGLLESQELENARVDARMKAQPSLVGSDGAVHFDSKTAIDADLVLVVDPRHPEDDHALRFHQAFQDIVLQILGMAPDRRLDGLEDLLNGLDKDRLVIALGPDLAHHLFNFVHHGSFLPLYNSASSAFLLRADTRSLSITFGTNTSLTQLGRNVHYGRQ